MRPPRSGTTTSDGRFKTTRSYIGPDGLPVRKEFVSRKGESQKKVKERADEWVATMRGKLPSPNMKLRRAVELWLEYHEEKGSAPATIDDYRFGTDLILADLGEVPINNVTPYSIEKITLRWSKAGKKRTAKKIRDNGRNLYNWLQRMRWATANPFEESEPVSYAPSTHEEPLTVDHVEKAIAAAKTAIQRAMLSLLAETGIRPKGARTLMWADIEEAEDGMWLRKRVKTDASDKPIPVPHRVATRIRALPKTSLYVFPSNRAPHYAEESVIAFWNRAQTKAGLEARNLYQLRHFWMTQMRRKGAIGPARARLSGQVDDATAAKFYDQFSREELRAIVES